MQTYKSKNNYFLFNRLLPARHESIACPILSIQRHQQPVGSSYRGSTHSIRLRLTPGTRLKDLLPKLTKIQSKILFKNNF